MRIVRNHCVCVAEIRPFVFDTRLNRGDRLKMVIRLRGMYGM